MAQLDHDDDGDADDNDDGDAGDNDDGDGGDGGDCDGGDGGYGGDGGGGCALHSGWDGLLGFPIMSTGLRARKGAYAHSMYNVQWINRSIDFLFP